MNFFKTRKYKKLRDIAKRDGYWKFSNLTPRQQKQYEKLALEKYGADYTGNSMSHDITFLSEEQRDEWHAAMPSGKVLATPSDFHVDLLPLRNGKWTMVGYVDGEIGIIVEHSNGSNVQDGDHVTLSRDQAHRAVEKYQREYARGKIDLWTI